jgi:serine/threonine protein kinase
LIGTCNPRNPKRQYHGQLHPKNIFCNFPVQFIWHRAVRDCLTEGVYGRLPYLPPEAVESNAVSNLKWDIYAFGVIMWQMVSRVVFPPDQYLDNEVYQIDRVTGVPNWYEQLYMACMDRDPSKRPTLDKIKADIELRSPKLKSVRVFRDIRLEPVDTDLLAYQNTRPNLVKAHLERMSATGDILWQSTSRAYSRQEIVNEIVFNMRSF